MPSTPEPSEQTPPARKTTLEHQVYVKLLRLVTELQQQVTELFKQHGLTAAQFNVLRILRGAGPEGYTCGDIIERLINKDPDVTRLLDRMEKQGWIVRARSTTDRRVVTSRITQQGLDALAPLDQPLLDLHQQQLGHLGAEKLHLLESLLEEIAQEH